MLRNLHTISIAEKKLKITNHLLQEEAEPDDLFALEQPKVGEQPVVPEYVLEDYYEASPTFNYEHSKNNYQRDYLLKQVEDDDLFLFPLVSLFL
jgi:hypothetical protein